MRSGRWNAVVSRMMNRHDLGPVHQCPGWYAGTHVELMAGLRRLLAREIQPGSWKIKDNEYALLQAAHRARVKERRREMLIWRGNKGPQQIDDTLKQIERDSA